MSYQAVRAVLEKSKQSGTTKLVLVCIAEHYNNDQGAAWPSVETLAGYCNVSRQAIHNAIKKLTDSGELEIEHKAGPHGVNMYRLPFLQDSSQSSEVDCKADLTVKPALQRLSSQLDGTVKPALHEPLITITEPLITTTTRAGQLATHYQSRTGNQPAGIIEAQMWEDDCLHILDCVKDDYSRAAGVMDEAITILDDKGYTHKEPGSLKVTIERLLQKRKRSTNASNFRNNRGSVQATGKKYSDPEQYPDVDPFKSSRANALPVM